MSDDGTQLSIGTQVNIRKQFPGNTRAVCIEYCHHAGFGYAGVQAGMECACGDIPPPEERIRADTECDWRCAGDGRQVCGGYGTMNVFTTGKFNA